MLLRISSGRRFSTPMSSCPATWLEYIKSHVFILTWVVFMYHLLQIRVWWQDNPQYRDLIIRDTKRRSILSLEIPTILITTTSWPSTICHHGNQSNNEVALHAHFYSRDTSPLLIMMINNGNVLNHRMAKLCSSSSKWHLQSGVLFALFFK